MEMSEPIDVLRQEGIVFLHSAASTRAEAVDIARKFGTVQDSEAVDQTLPDDPERQRQAESSRQSVAALDLHTDSSQHDVPSALITLYCEQSDPDGGGATTWLHVDDILNALKAGEEGRAAIDVLASAKVPFVQPNGVTPRLKWFPVFSEGTAGTTIRFTGANIRFGIIEAEESGRPISTDVASALSTLQRTIRDLEPQTRALIPGDIVIIDNHRVLHGRTAIKNAAARSLWRVKLGSADAA
ncbi:TauD/TfdA family dioxygenase [Streptomyces sp. NPDC088270]|uniref:TauD/TfdA family dioxygenase n=1 Tax=Streptomyces sp. NPDC088270 TaxID=3160990 RepID=UPI0034211471